MKKKSVIKVATSLVASLTILLAVSVPSIVTYAEGVKIEEHSEVLSIQEDSVELVVDEEAVEEETSVAEQVQELEAEDYIEVDVEGNVVVTDKYVETVQASIGDEFAVSAEGNTLRIQERSIIGNITGMVEGFILGKGETKIVYTGSSIDIYLSSGIVNIGMSGVDLVSFLISLIPIPTVMPLITTVISWSKTIFGWLFVGENGMIVSIKTLNFGNVNTYIPYFIWLSKQ